MGINFEVSSWFLTVVACWFGLLGVQFGGILAHWVFCISLGLSDRWARTLVLGVPFSKWPWFINFIRCGGILEYMNCSMMAWEVITNASFASFWSSSRKSKNFWIDGLKTTFWILCFAVAIDWGLTFLQENCTNFLRFPQVGLLMFLNICNSSLFDRKWNFFFLWSSVSWVKFLRFASKRSTNSSIFSEFPSNEGIVLMSDYGNLENLLKLLLKSAEFLWLVNCWKPTKVDLLQSWQGCSNCKMLLTCKVRFQCMRTFQVSKTEYLFVNFSHSVGRLVWAEFFRRLTQVDTHFRMRIFLATILNCFLVPFIWVTWVPGRLRNEAGVYVSWWDQNKIIYFGQGNQNAAPCPTKLLGQFLCHSTLNFFWHLSNRTLLNSRKFKLPRLVIPVMFLMLIPIDGCQLFFSRSSHLQRKGKKTQHRWKLN